MTHYLDVTIYLSVILWIIVVCNDSCIGNRQDNWKPINYWSIICSVNCDVLWIWSAQFGSMRIDTTACHETTYPHLHVVYVCREMFLQNSYTPEKICTQNKTKNIVFSISWCLRWITTVFYNNISERNSVEQLYYIHPILRPLVHL